MKYTKFFIFCLVIVTACFFIYKNFFKKESVNKTTTSIPNSNANSNTKSFKIIAFGDSLTAGYGVELKDSYPKILEDKLKLDTKFVNKNITVINMGVSGETTTGGLERVNFVISQNPDLILLGLGANDMLRATKPEITKNNLDSIIKKFKEKNLPIVLLGVESQASNGPSFKKDFDAIYPSLAKKYSLPLVPFFLKGVALVPSLNIADGIHPNRNGYEKIVTENIMPVLITILNK